MCDEPMTPSRKLNEAVQTRMWIQFLSEKRAEIVYDEARRIEAEAAKRSRFVEVAVVCLVYLYYAAYEA